jgi:hypothetical protein
MVKIVSNKATINPAQVNSDREYTIGDKKYDLGNISALSDAAEGKGYSTVTLENAVNREGAAKDERSAWEKAHSSSNGRATVTIPVDIRNEDMRNKAQFVSDHMEDFCRKTMSKFIEKHGITRDRDQMIRSEAYRRAKQEATYDREFTEQERDARIGDLMPKKKHAGRFKLGVRVSVRDTQYDKPNSPAWRDTEVGRAGVYNQWGTTTVPLTSSAMVAAAEIISKEVASVIIPAVSGVTDLTTIWNNLYEACSNLKAPDVKVVHYEFSEEEEKKIEEIKLEMISRLGG